MTACLVVAGVALVASALSLFSGFGLGTLLLPAFAPFFSLPVAVAATAVVHLSNNAFKLTLLGRHADRAVLWRFGAPALLAAFIGGALLDALAGLSAVGHWTAAGHAFVVTPVRLVIAALMTGFALLDLSPRFARLALDRRCLPLGGALSGFFGGLSGHQGALRSAFLTRAGLSPESFIATGVVIACLVDVTRLVAYAPLLMHSPELMERAPLLVTAIAAAFVGAFVGARLLRKTTMAVIRAVVAVGLLLLAAAIGSGLV